jgi:hypothetical protein
MPHIDIAYEQLPQQVKDNIAEDQWPAAQREVIADGDLVPDAAYYINLKNGQIHQYDRGQPANGPLLPVHGLAGGRGRDNAQFENAPEGAHPAPGEAPSAPRRG